MSKYASIAIWSDNLYFINENPDDSVTCCDIQGTLKWKLELAAVLEMARGITVGNDGHVYVSGYKSSKVVVISPDGKIHKL